MPAPRPLTATPPPRLDFSNPKAPVAIDFDDVYFSTDGGLAETRDIFLRACGLPERWASRPHFTIGELGFGTGLNVLAAWQMWDAVKVKNGHLHIVSYEGFPLDRGTLARTLAQWTGLQTYAERLLNLWPGRVFGVHRLRLSESVTLTLVHDEISAGLEALDFKADAWFLDGFNPAKNPAMWTADVLKAVADRSAPGCHVGTFTVAGSVRRSLSDAGFHVRKLPGFGRKRDRVEAIRPGRSPAKVSPQPPIIIGGGIAGASISRACIARGIIPILIDADPALTRAASGNPAAMVKPRLDKQDRPESRFFLSAYLYALRSYQDRLQTGIWQVAKSEDEAKRFQAITDVSPLPKNHMTWHTQDSAEIALGCSAPYGALEFPEAAVIAPQTICEAWTKKAHRITARVTGLTRKGNTWQAWSGNKLLAESNQVFVCAGANIERLIEMPMRYSRGQLTWANGALPAPVSYGGYAMPMDGAVLVGATHDRLDRSDPYVPKAESDEKNLSQLNAILGLGMTPLRRPSRSSVRVTTPDTLPRIHTRDGLSVLTGLGSRGFVFAPLLGEALVSDWLGGVPAISKRTTTRFTARETPTVKRA